MMTSADLQGARRILLSENSLRQNQNSKGQRRHFKWPEPPQDLVGCGLRLVLSGQRLRAEEQAWAGPAAQPHSVEGPVEFGGASGSLPEPRGPAPPHPTARRSQAVASDA